MCFRTKASFSCRCGLLTLRIPDVDIVGIKCRSELARLTSSNAFSAAVFGVRMTAYGYGNIGDDHDGYPDVLTGR